MAGFRLSEPGSDRLRVGRQAKRRSPRGRRILEGLCISTGIVSALYLLVILADAGFLIVLTVEKAHNAWYFPYSVFVLPVLIVSGPDRKSVV